jgi:hypothetical protein
MNALISPAEPLETSCSAWAPSVLLEAMKSAQQVGQEANRAAEQEAEAAADGQTQG